jgi:signal transduction histidine kinase/ActR/RegA family two-component response regulator
MLRMPRVTSSRFYALLDAFIPPAVKRDIGLRQRARMFLISHLFGPFLGNTITVYLYILDKSPGAAFWVLAASITAFWIFPFALRLGAPFTLLGVVSVQNLIFAILWGCYNYGGVSSPFLPWLLTVPLLAFFYLGASRNTRSLVLGLIGVNLVAFYAVYLFAHSFPQHIPLAQLSGIGIISTLCAAIYVSMMALYYASVVASQSELEHEVIRDLQISRQFSEAKAEAERANQAKSEFLAKMSHELRTPLNAVIGYSEMLLEETDAADRHEQSADLRKIRDAGQHLLALVSDVLDLSKLEAGKMELYPESLGLGTLIDDIVAACQQAVAARGNQLIVDCPDNLGIIEADGAKLRQAVLYLMSNAAKFTSNGRVTLSVTRPPGKLTIAVRDTGVGISPKNMTGLFQNFGESEGATASKYGGTGLGLALGQKLCRLMGGEITVESQLGRGSCFTISIPIREGSAAGAPSALGAASEPAKPVEAPGAAQPHGEPVLVIDDDPAVLDLVARTLTKEGFWTITAGDARSGLELAKTTRPAVIVLDVRMPDIDGWQMLQMMASDAELKPCPIVLLTVEDDLQKGRAHGVAGHLVKPIDREQLVAAIARLCGKTGAAASGRSKAMELAGRPAVG